MGRKNKYNARTFPKLAETMARRGYLDKEIYQSLKISKASFENYKAKYPEFRNALEKGREPIILDLEKALIRSALGYDYKEEVLEMENDNFGNPKVKGKKIMTKHQAPTVKSLEILLKKLDPDYWGKINDEKIELVAPKLEIEIVKPTKSNIQVDKD